MKVAEHNVDDGTHAGHGRADSDTGKSCFRNGSIENTMGPEFFDQTRENFERSACFRNILAKNADSSNRGASLPPVLREPLAQKLVLASQSSGINVLLHFIDLGIRRGHRKLHRRFISACTSE